MNPVAIKVENLSKRYRIGLKDEIHDTFAGAFTSFIRSPAKNLRRLRRLTRFSEDGDDPGPPSSVPGPSSSISDPPSSVPGPPSDVIWALKDVSFEVKPGEVVGIIGRNGAGKSTLLKILSRITHPTSGRVELRGRVSSLLEVGTGFHPELTGRENIYLNGTILGMRKSEIDHKFDEIVEFSGVEKFIDTPVKRYSSGMRVRLAFSVAAHLEPEILLIDEVLAVGDAGFQKKCLGKMENVAEQGRTVIFVSHQLGMIRTLCERAILLNEGRLLDDGQSPAIIDRYVLSIGEQSEEQAEVFYPEEQSLNAQFLSISVRNQDGKPSTRYDVFDTVSFQACIAIREPLTGMGVNLIVQRNGEVLFRTYDTDAHPERLKERSPGLYFASVDFPTPLKAGYYTITPIIGILNIGGVDKKVDALSITIEETSFDTSLSSYSSKRSGVMAVHLEWDFDQR